MSNGKGTAALQGAASGAAIGSAFGPIGTGVGAGLGGLAGWFGSGSGGQRGGEFRDVDPGAFGIPDEEARRRRLLDAAGRFGGQAAPQARGARIGPFGQTGTSGFRAGQERLVEQLQRRASGEDSLSEQQLRAGAGTALAQQQALAASARPGQQGAAARTAAQQAGRITGGLAGQAALAGIQERTAAQQALGGVLAGARGQDIGQMQFNVAQENQRLMEQARMAQQAGQFNVSAQLQQRAMNNQAMLEAMGMELQQAGMAQQGRLAAEQARTQRFMGLAGQPTGMERLLGGLGGVGQFIGAVK